MESIIINIPSKKELKFLTELAEKMGFTSRKLSPQEKEDMAMVNAITEAKQGDFVSRESVMKALRKWKFFSKESF